MKNQATYIHNPTVDEKDNVIVAQITYKMRHVPYNKMIQVADDLFGKGQWERFRDLSNSLGNILGWYAVNNDGECLLCQWELV